MGKRLSWSISRVNHFFKRIISNGFTDMSEQVIEPTLINDHRPASSLRLGNGHSEQTKNPVGLSLLKAENQLNSEDM